MRDPALSGNCPVSRLTHQMLRSWVRFNAVGIIGLVVQLLVLAVLLRFGLHYLVATTVAVEAAVLHNFLWHERWTWSERASTFRPGAAAVAISRVQWTRVHRGQSCGDATARRRPRNMAAASEPHVCAAVLNRELRRWLQADLGDRSCGALAPRASDLGPRLSDLGPRTSG